MTFNQVYQGIKITAGLGVIFVLICAGLFFLQLRGTLRNVDSNVASLTSSAQTEMKGIHQEIDDVKVMLNTTLFQAEELLHHTDVLVAQESHAQEAQLAHVNDVLTQLQTTVSSLDDSQKKIADSATKALDTLPGVTTQLQSTLAETQTTVAKTGDAIVALTKLESDLDPTVQHINETTGHLDNVSAALDQVVQRATKPQPWYKKIVGYIWVPIKLVTIFAK